jgi:hypothetical protein
VSVRSCEATAALSAVCTSTDVVVETFGMLIESVPCGRSRLRARFAATRPARSAGMYSSISHSGGTK